MISDDSRYAKTPTYEAVDAQGETLTVLELRELPDASSVFAATPHQGQRLDHLAQRYYRDPRRFWRICDASVHLDPFDVVFPGRPVNIPPDK